MAASSSFATTSADAEDGEGGGDGAEEVLVESGATDTTKLNASPPRDASPVEFISTTDPSMATVRAGAWNSSRPPSLLLLAPSGEPPLMGESEPGRAVATGTRASEEPSLLLLLG